jgi:alpha-D-ribose 1-methylphosphonate 5-triphosphate synthase subunit PhnG
VAELEIHYADEWAALYVDGRLKSVGDTYVAEEQALTMCGVKLVHDDAFMRGQDRREGVAPTLADAAIYRDEREQRRAKAAEMREQAKRMLDDAAELESRRG